MNNIVDKFHPLRDTTGAFLGLSLISGELVITNFSCIDREIIVSKDNTLSLGGKKIKKDIKSIAELQKELVKLTIAVHKSIVDNKIYIRCETEDSAESLTEGFHFEMPTINECLIHQLMFDILYYKFLRESPKLTLNQYCEKWSDIQEVQNKINKSMAAQIELELGKIDKGGEVKKGIYSNSDLIKDAEEFGFDLVKYIKKLRSQNEAYKDKRDKKTKEYKPRRECEWDYVFYNGKSGLITTKQFRRLLEHDSNYSYESFVEDFKTYDCFVKDLFKSRKKDDEDYFLKAMGFYHLEIYKRLDFIYKLAVIMEKNGISEITRNHFLVRRFYPHIYLPYISNERCHIVKKRRYYRPLLFIEKKWMELVEQNQSDNNQYFVACYNIYLIRAIIYELFRYNFNFVPKDYKAISKFIRKHYNILGYHESKKIWHSEEKTKLNIRRIINAQNISKALFWASDKRPKIKKGKKHT